MSTIIATTLSNGSVSVPTATVVNGSAKAWVLYQSNVTPLVIHESFAISSITYSGTGNQNVNFTSSFNAAEGYITLGNSSWRGIANPEVWTTTYCQIYTTDTANNNLSDRARVHVSFTGDLA